MEGTMLLCLPQAEVSCTGTGLLPARSVGQARTAACHRVVLSGLSQAVQQCWRMAAQLLTMLPAVTAEIMGGKGRVLSLAAHMMGHQARMLIVHEQTGALVWDVRWARMPSAGQSRP